MNEPRIERQVQFFAGRGGEGDEPLDRLRELRLIGGEAGMCPGDRLCRPAQDRELLPRGFRETALL
jgi:hypothetical protein